MSHSLSLWLVLLVLVLSVAAASVSVDADQSPHVCAVDVGSSQVKVAIPSHAGGAKPLYFGGEPSFARLPAERELDPVTDEGAGDVDAPTQEERSLSRLLRRVRTHLLREENGWECTHPLWVQDAKLMTEDAMSLTSVERAFRLAGFPLAQPVTPVERPLAVAYQHGFAGVLKRPGRFGFVADLGATSMDLSLVHLSPRRTLLVFSSKSFPEVSAEAFVDRVVAYIVERIKKERNVDISAEGKEGFLEAVREETRRGIQRLYLNRLSMLDLSFRVPEEDFHLDLKIDKSIVSRMSIDLLRLIPELVKQFVETSGVTLDEVVVLATCGGGAMIREAREGTRYTFGRDIAMFHTPQVSAVVGAVLSIVEHGGEVEQPSWNAIDPYAGRKDEL